MPRKVLITGGAGYLGRFVTERLSSNNQVRIFDRVPTPKPCRDGIEVLLGDIAREKDVREAVAGCDSVVHLVALVRGRNQQPSESFLDVMVKGTHNVMLAASEERVARVVNVSSISAIGYGHPAGTPLREDCRPQFGDGDLFYALSKYLGEQIGLAYHQARGLSVIQLRPGVIAGDGANPGPKIPAPPARRWFNYVDPRDVAQAIELALQADVDYGEFFIVADHPESRYDIGAAKELLGYAPEHNWLDVRAFPGTEGQ